MGALECFKSSDKISPSESTNVFAVNMASTTTLTKDPDTSQMAKENNMKRHSLWWHVGTDLPILILVLLLVGLFELGVIPSYKAGFYCNDPKLSFPFTGDTVSMGFLVGSTFLFPPILIFIMEFIIQPIGQPYKRKSLDSLWTVGVLYRDYIHGMVINLCVVELVKGVTGNPRPNFFAVCKPDTGLTCRGSEFVSTFECTNEDFSEWYRQDSYHSFPSGHASLSIYCGFYMAWYLHRRVFNWSHKSVLIVPLIQFLCMTYALLGALTRISDRRHHWWDVLVGVGWGILTLIYTVFGLTHNFNRVPKQGNDMMDSTNTSQRLLSNNSPVHIA